MPQEHYVLKCFSCETFQAHIVKKSKKWECKVCGAKQSFKRNYGKGSGVDCRRQVMKLNELRLTNKSIQNQAICNLLEDATDSNSAEEYSSVEKLSISKWAAYLELNNEDDFLSEIFEKKNENIYQNQTTDLGSVLCKKQNCSQVDEKSQMIEPKTGKYRVENNENDFNIFESNFSDLDSVLNF